MPLPLGQLGVLKQPSAADQGRTGGRAQSDRSDPRAAAASPARANTAHASQRNRTATALHKLLSLYPERLQLLRALPIPGGKATQPLQDKQPPHLQLGRPLEERAEGRGGAARRGSQRACKPRIRHHAGILAEYL